MTLLLDDFFVKSLSYMLAVWPCLFLFVWARGAVPSWDGTAMSNLLYYQDLMTEL